MNKKIQKIYKNHPLIKGIYNRINSKLRLVPKGYSICDSDKNLFKTTQETVEVEGKTFTHNNTKTIEPSREFASEQMVRYTESEFTHMFYDIDGGFIWRVYGTGGDREYWTDTMILPANSVKSIRGDNFRNAFYEDFDVNRLKDKWGNSVHRAYDVFLDCELITQEEYDQVNKVLEKISQFIKLDIGSIDKKIKELEEQKQEGENIISKLTENSKK